MSVTGIGRIAMADRMSVDQLKEALQNKTLPAYIAIPLIEEKMDMRDRMMRSQAMQGAAQQKAPIGEEILARTDAGIDQLPTGLPATGMAGGGIVAFEDGGEVVHAQSGLYVNPYLANYIREMETGGIRNPDLAVSPKGARGVMQIMPATAMKPGFGVPTIFELADAAGIGYEGKTEEEAKRLLTNRNLNVAFGEQYAGAMQRKFGDNPVLAAAAYNAGPGAVTRAGGVPDIAETKKYVAGISPERFEAARKSVQDARRQQLESLSLGPTGVSMMPYRSVMEGKDKAPTDYEALLKSREVRPATPGLGSTFDPELQATQPTPSVAPAPTPSRDATQDFADFLTGRRPITPASPEMIAAASAQRGREAPAPAAPAPAAPKEEEDSDIASLRKSIAARRAELGKQREQDKAMALLAAGLGILSGTSPRALENIGKGALQGVEYARGARKEQREAEQDVLASELGLSRATLYEKMRIDQLKSNKDIAQAKTAISQQLADLKQQQGYRDAVDMWNNSTERSALEKDIAKRYGKNWQQDDKAKLELQTLRNRYITELLRGGRTAGIPSYAQLMGQ